MIAAGLVLSALLVAIAATTWGWKRSSDAADTVKKSLAEVTQERDAKDEALTAESAQREQAERRMCEGILRPIGHGDEPNSAELRAFVDWSALPDNRLKLKVLEVAFEDPDTALRVARRSDRAMQACVTLSPKRLATALKLLVAKQRDLQADPKIRVAACWLTMELGSQDTLALEECLTLREESGSHAAEPRQFSYRFIYDFARYVPSLSPEQVSRSCDTLMDVQRESVAYGIQSDMQGAAWNAMAALAPKLDSTQLICGWDTLIDVHKKDAIHGMTLHLENDVQEAARNALAALAAELDTAQVTRRWDIFIDVLEKSNDIHMLTATADALVALAPQLDAAQVTRGREKLMAMNKRPVDAFLGRSASMIVLEALAPRVNTAQIVPVGDTLIDMPGKTDDRNVQETASAPDVDRGQLTNDWDTQIGWLGTADLFFYEYAMAGDALVVLAPQLDSRQVAHGWDMLIGVLGEAENWAVHEAAGYVLVALAPKLKAAQRGMAIEQMIAALDQIYYPAQSLKPLVEMARSLGASALDLYCRNANASLLDLHATREQYFYDKDRERYVCDVFDEPTMAMTDRRMVAALLQHPGCCDAPRDYMLQRFKELIFHDGRHVFLTDPDSQSPTITAESSVPQPNPDPPPRRFYTVHDAAAWIEQNWPDFDLEATMPVTWRGQE